MRLPTLAAAAVMVDILAVAVLGAITPGHDPVHGYISTLGIHGAPYRTAYVAAGTVSAALHLIWVVRLKQLHASTGWAVATAMLGAFFVLQWSAAAMFPCDPGCAWLTTRGMLHYAISFTAFVIIHVGIIAVTTLAWPMARRGRRVAVVLGALAVANALVLLAADRTGVFHGLVERISILLFGAWSIALSWAIGRDDGHGTASRAGG